MISPRSGVCKTYEPKKLLKMISEGKVFMQPISDLKQSLNFLCEQFKTLLLYGTTTIDFYRHPTQNTAEIDLLNAKTFSVING